MEAKDCMTSRTVHRVDPYSATVVFAVFGLVTGVFAGLMILSTPTGRGVALYPAFVLSSTVAGGLFGGVQALAYNLSAKRLGGLRIDLRETSPKTADELTNDDLVRCPHCHSLDARDNDRCQFCGESLETPER